MVRTLYRRNIPYYSALSLYLLYVHWRHVWGTFIKGEKGQAVSDWDASYRHLDNIHTVFFLDRVPVESNWTYLKLLQISYLFGILRIHSLTSARTSMLFQIQGAHCTPALSVFEQIIEVFPTRLPSSNALTSLDDIDDLSQQEYGTVA